MTARVAAGRLGHVDLGKTITAPEPIGGFKAELVGINITPDLIGLEVRLGMHADAFTIHVDPHQLVTITGKEAAA